MSHERPVAVLCRLCGHMAIGLAVVVNGVPASFAQGSQTVDRGKLAGTATDLEEGQEHELPGGKSGISVAVPIGMVSVGPKFVDGEPIYVRRMTVRDRITIVEISTTPFMPILTSGAEPPGVQGSVARPDQPASW